MQKLAMIVPSLLTDFNVCRNHLDYFFDLLPITNIVFIGDQNVQKAAVDLGDKRISCVNEKEIYDLSKVKRIIEMRSGGNPDAMKRAGWYYQQFLKLLYAEKCDEDYYLSWDSDTIPVHLIKMIENGKPLFDMKTEYHEPYFNTIQRLFGIEKKVKESFISEHMLFHTQTVREMLSVIAKNDSLPGEDFCEKVLIAAGGSGYEKLAFSEFETYGTYMLHYHPELYGLRKWESLRMGGLYFDTDMLDDNLIQWLSTYYDAISFEKGLVKLKYVSNIIQSAAVRKIINARMFEKFHKLYSAFRKTVRKLIH